MPISNEQLLLLNRIFNPFQHSVEECEDEYVAVRHLALPKFVQCIEI